MKLVKITLLLLIVVPCLRAQNKEISQARSYIKSGKNLDQAEKLMTELLAKDSCNRKNPKIYDTWYQVVQKQYDDVNEKLYLKQKCDTSVIYNLSKKIYDIFVALDSVDVLPDDKGKIKPKYRKKNAKLMNTLRPNLYYGGMFHLNKGENAKAFELFDKYIDCAFQPLLVSYHYADKDTLLKDAAYWATYAAYLDGDADNVLKHSKLALDVKEKSQYTLSYIAEAYRMKKDKDAFLSTVIEGFERFPGYSYFFPRLMDYYITANQQDSALMIVNKALDGDAQNELFLYAKSSLLLNMGHNTECVAVSDRLIALNDSFPEAYYNAGMAYINTMLEIEKENATKLNKADAQERRELVRQQTEKQNDLCSKAMPYMERYRQLAPAEVKKWAPVLYKIYFTLNLGRKFDEIDSIMNKK